MNTKRIVLLVWLCVSTLNPQLSTAFAQGTAFMYQGRLTDNGAPADGNYELRFAIYDATAAGNAVGSPITNSPVAVAEGVNGEA